MWWILIIISVIYLLDWWVLYNTLKMYFQESDDSILVKDMMIFLLYIIIPVIFPIQLIYGILSGELLDEDSRMIFGLFKKSAYNDWKDINNIDVLDDIQLKKLCYRLYNENERNKKIIAIRKL